MDESPIEREAPAKFFIHDYHRSDAEVHREVHLLDYWRVIKKRKWVVLGVLLVVVTVVAIRMYQSRVVYEASGKVIINQQTPIRLANEQEGVQYPSNDTQYLETQLNVLQSQALARRVIDELSLPKHPEFADLAPTPDPDLRDKLLADRFLSGLSVELLRNTRIVKVTYASHDPKLASDTVNTLMDQLIVYTLTARFDSTKQAREWLNKRLTELQEKLEETRQELVRYSQENQIVELGKDQTIAIERLTDLNRRLVEAEADRIQAETLYRLSKKSNGDNLPAVASDPMVQSLRQRLADDQRKLVELQRRFTDQWPEVRTLKSQIEESDRQLAETKQRILARIEADYKTAVSREQRLRAELETQRNETLRQNERAVNLSIKQQQVEASAQLYSSLLQKLNDVDLLSTLTTTNIQILDRAQVPIIPARPRKLFNIGLSALGGLLAGVLLALFVEYLDNTVKSTSDVDRLLGLPSLGVVPALESLERRGRLALPKLGASKRQSQPILILDQQHRSSFAEAFRSLRTSVLLSHAERPPRTILFTSSSPGEGKTTTAVNTAISLAQTGARVILVDGDLRKPGLHKMLNMKNQPGLSTYLTRAIDLDSVVDQNQIENLWIIASGPIPPNPSELLSSGKMREAVKLLSQQYDFVIFDSPPVSTPDALILSTMVDGVILVIRCGETPRELVHRAKQSLEDVNAKIFGVVLNRVDVQHDGYYYYYYRYYYGDDQPGDRPS
jgi:capsular exopolysaccharide synthesis family protein